MSDYKGLGDATYQEEEHVEVRNTHTMMDHVRRGIKSFRRLTCGQLLLVIMSVSLVIGGNIGQLLALNLWIQALDQYAHPFAILTVSASTNALMYGVILAVWLLVKRKSISFVANRTSFTLITVTGLCNALNGVAIVFATQDTPEVVQAFLLSSQLIWIFIFVKLAFKEERSYCNPLVLLSFACSLGGIVLGMATQIASSKPMTKNGLHWALIFAAGMIPGALYNVVAAKFLRRYTKPAEPELIDEEAALNQSPMTPEYPLPMDTHAVHDNLTVKITMLFFTGVSQALWLFALLPLDAVPWFGSSSDIGATGINLAKGYQCTFTTKFAPECPNTFWYFVAFNISYLLNYIGSAFLNMYSPALTSIVTQLSSPLGAVVIIAFPVFDTQHITYNLAESIGAVLLLVIGSLIYTAWEESTKKAEKHQHE